MHPQHRRSFDSLGRGEPYAIVQLLPRCAVCFAPHPLARRPALEAANCPDCGASLAPAAAGRFVRPKLGGLAGALAETCFNIAHWLRRLAKET